jgi:hypothetical protein
MNMMHRRKKSGEQSDSAFYLYIDEEGSILTNEGKDKKKIPEAELSLVSVYKCTHG